MYFSKRKERIWPLLARTKAGIMRYTFLAFIVYWPENFDNFTKIGRSSNDKKYKDDRNIEIVGSKEFICFNSFFFPFEEVACTFIVICCSKYFYIFNFASVLDSLIG